jgi:hypothetical protein
LDVFIDLSFTFSSSKVDKADAHFVIQLNHTFNSAELKVSTDRLVHISFFSSFSQPTARSNHPLGQGFLPRMILLNKDLSTHKPSASIAWEMCLSRLVVVTNSEGSFIGLSSGD